MQGLKLGNVGQWAAARAIQITSSHPFDQIFNWGVYMSCSMGVITLEDLSLICMSILLATIDQISRRMDFIYRGKY
jgi:hypothetical protein